MSFYSVGPASLTVTPGVSSFNGLTGDVVLAASSNIALTLLGNTTTVAITGAIPIANGGTGQTTANTAFAALSPLTTKGDIIGYSTIPARLPVGIDGQILAADSTQALGIKWAPAPASGANTALSNLTATSINMSLVPTSLGGIDLGSVTNTFDNLFINVGVIDPAGFFILDANARKLVDSNGQEAMRFDKNNGQRTLNDQTGMSALTFDSRTLVDADGTSIILDWSQKIINDAAQVLSIDFQNRTLNDSSSGASINYNSRIAFDSGGVRSILWNTHQLRDSSNNNSIDWQFRLLEDNSGNNSIDYANRFLYQPDGVSVSIDYSDTSQISFGLAAKLFSSASDPGGVTAGAIYYNTTSNKIKMFNGTTWETVTSS